MASGLPPNWEWDYDGSRWFYKYKPTGHVQFHFPSEGDEFPDFVDATAPAPDLAPEERLESQQQVKRHTSLSGRSHERHGGSRPSSKGRPVMSAKAQPVSAVWEDDVGDGSDVFQPENFMFLGPGTYLDVSPLAEEEDEAAKRAIAGVGESPTASSSKASPVSSAITTPRGVKSGATPSPLQNVATVVSDTVDTSTQLPDAEKHDSEGGEEVLHMLDSREMPHELPAVERYNPVGFMAEMPTEHTGVAHIELHPEPVEIGDATVLAPIETTAPGGLAELPEIAHAPVKEQSNIPAEKQHQEEQAEGKKATKHKPADQQITTASQGIEPKYKHYEKPPTRQPGAVGRPDEQAIPAVSLGEEPKYKHYETPTNAQSAEQVHQQVQPKPAPQAFKVPRKVPGSGPKQNEFQPYVPGQEHPGMMQYSSSNFGAHHNTGSLQREASLLMGPKHGSKINNSTPVFDVSPPQDPSKVLGGDTETHRKTAVSDENLSVQSSEQSQEQGLSHVPSVLKPAKNKNPVPAQPSPSPPMGQLAEPPSRLLGTPVQDSNGASSSLSKVPSILNPTRRRPPMPQPEQEFYGRPEIQRHSTDPKYLSHMTDTQQKFPQLDNTTSSFEMQKPQLQPQRPLSAMPVVQQDRPEASNQTNALKQQLPEGHASPLSQVSSLSSIDRAHPSPSVPSPPQMHHELQDSKSPQRSTITTRSRQLSEPDDPSLPGLRRRSTVDSAGVSPLRSRAESQVSMFQGQTPSPMEPLRRVQSNTLVPETSTPDPSLHQEQHDTVLSSREESPPVPSKVPLDSSQPSYFSANDARPRKIVSKRHSLPASPLQTLSYDGDSTTTQPPSYGKQTKGDDSERMDAQPLAPATIGHFLGRIEEHDEHEAASVSVSSPSPADTRRHSMASSLQKSPIMSKKEDMQETQPSGASAQQATVSQHQEPSQIAPIQNHPQQQLAQPQHIMIPPPGEMGGPIYPPLSMSPSDQKMPNSSAPLQHGFATPGQPVPPQTLWNGPMQPVVPPPGFQLVTIQAQAPGKDKEKKWTKWFKSSKQPRENMNSSQQHFMNQPPGVMPMTGTWNQPPPQLAPGQQGPPAQGWQPNSHMTGPHFARPPGVPQQFVPMQAMSPVGTGMTQSLTGGSMLPLQRRSTDSGSTAATVDSDALRMKHVVIPQGLPQGLPSAKLAQSVPPNARPSQMAAQSRTTDLYNGPSPSETAVMTSLPQGQEQTPQHAQQSQHQANQSFSSVTAVEQNAVPAPLFSKSGMSKPLPSNQGPVPGIGTAGTGSVSRSMTKDKWAKKTPVDYSGGDWGDEDDWERQRQ